MTREGFTTSVWANWFALHWPIRTASHYGKTRINGRSVRRSKSPRHADKFPRPYKSDLIARNRITMVALNWQQWNALSKWARALKCRRSIKRRQLAIRKRCTHICASTVANRPNRNDLYNFQWTSKCHLASTRIAFHAECFPYEMRANGSSVNFTSFFRLSIIQQIVRIGQSIFAVPFLACASCQATAHLSNICTKFSQQKKPIEMGGLNAIK